MKFSPGFEPYFYRTWRGGQHNRTPSFACKVNRVSHKRSTIMANVRLRVFWEVR